MGVISWEETDTKADASLQQVRQRKQRTTLFASAVFCHEQMHQQKTAKMLISSSLRGKVPTPLPPLS